MSVFVSETAVFDTGSCTRSVERPLSECTQWLGVVENRMKTIHDAGTFSTQKSGRKDGANMRRTAMVVIAMLVMLCYSMIVA